MMSNTDPDKHLRDPGEGAPQILAPVSTSFSLPEVSEFKIVNSAECCGNGTFEVMDLAGNLLFRYRSSSFWSTNQILHDDYGRALATLKQKSSVQLQFNVYRGKKPHTEADLLFRIGKPKVKRKNTFDIWLAGKDEPDFTFILKYSKTHQFAISHQGEIIAKAKKETKFFKPTEITVTANAGVDRAFVASVLVMERIVEQNRANAGAAAGAAGAAAAAASGNAAAAASGGC